jgi:hypothetical protein
MIFVFPMAGDSRRFSEAGFAPPKFLLAAHGASLFDHAVGSFESYFGQDHFLFIVRDRSASAYVAGRCSGLGIVRAEVVDLGEPTLGQADTVRRGIEAAAVPDQEPMIVFNIDTFRPGYRKPNFVDDPDCAGYVEVFRGSGEGWSFAAPIEGRPDRAACLVEKRRISSLCCTGLYYFRSAGEFRWAYANPPEPASAAEQRERYVAPLYNALIAAGHRINLAEIARGDVIFCGTPSEYAETLVSEEIGRRLRQ